MSEGCSSTHGENNHSFLGVMVRSMLRLFLAKTCVPRQISHFRDARFGTPVSGNSGTVSIYECTRALRQWKQFSFRGVGDLVLVIHADPLSGFPMRPVRASLLWEFVRMRKICFFLWGRCPNGWIFMGQVSPYPPSSTA